MGKTKTLTKIQAFPEWVIKAFKSYRWQTWVLYCAILFIVGTIINVKTEFSFRFFITHQLLLITATTMLLFAMKSFFNDMYLFCSNSRVGLLDKNPEISSLFKKRLLPLQRTAWPFLAAILITSFFFICIVLLEYIEIDIIGIYAIYIAGTSVLVGVYGYIQYLLFLWFIYHAGKCTYKDFDKYVPAETSWVMQIAKTSQRLRNYFLFIGLIYVIEYSILIPTDKIEITDTSIALHLPNNLAFIISWVALLVLVIVAFPVINHIQRTLVVKLISRLKEKSISDLSDMMFIEHELIKDKKGRLTTVMTYSVLIDNIRQSKKYPINRQLSYEAVMTLVTFVVHTMNLYNKIASIPQLSTLLPQL